MKKQLTVTSMIVLFTLISFVALLNTCKDSTIDSRSSSHAVQKFEENNVNVLETNEVDPNLFMDFSKQETVAYCLNQDKKAFGCRIDIQTPLEVPFPCVHVFQFTDK